MRVYEIARIAGVESSTVRDYLAMLGQPAKSATSVVRGEHFIQTLISRLVQNKE